ncbi:hypothetical protein RF55_8185 [Lasius niger]|uniref:Uncharacterized protein n=1 Tax=Lasius niger TaxID=67767 RepID=A0A0J7KNR1_LASNI|nr:hypothetical protein RF55_8185 [Lasius niger]
MKCHHHGRTAHGGDDDEDDDEGPAEETDQKRPAVEEMLVGEAGEGERTRSDKKDLQGPSNARKEPAKHDASSRCTVTAGANAAALDFTLNCNSVRLTSRDTSLKTATRGER